jgi:hypothetical protein
MEEGDKGRRRITKFITNEWSKTAPDGAIAALYMAALFVCEGLVWVQTLLTVKKVHPGLANLRALTRFHGAKPHMKQRPNQKCHPHRTHQPLHQKIQSQDGRIMSLETALA